MSTRSGEILFLRPTSGLTKYFGQWTSLFAIIGASLGVWQWMFVGTLQNMYPGINAGMTWGVGMVFMLIYTVMMTLLSIAMPRSSGLYQISARGFNPVAGMLAVWRGIIANPIIKASEFYIFLVFMGAAFTQWGAATGNLGLQALGQTFVATQPAVLVLASIILMAIFAVIAYLGPLFRIEPRIQMIGGVFSTIGWVLAIVVLAATPSSAVQTRWDAVWGSGAYAEVQTIATTAGYSATLYSTFSLTMTLMATIWPIGLVWPYLILLYGGEVSDPAKNLVFTQLLGGLILAGLLTAGAGMFQRTFGTFTTQYSYAYSAVASGSATFTSNQLFTGGFGTFSALMTDNPVISGWILLSAPVIGLTATPINMAWVTRGFFQASLDRVMPSFFGNLSRFHTPTLAIIYWFLFGVPFTVAIAAGAGNLVSVITSLIALWGIEMIFQSLAAIQLPFLKPALYEGSIKKQPVLFGIPLISILGIVILPTSLFVLIGFAQGAAFISMVSMAVQYGFSALWFVAYALHLRKKNIDIGTIYESLPPE